MRQHYGTIEADSAPAAEQAPRAVQADRPLLALELEIIRATRRAMRKAGRPVTLLAILREARATSAPEWRETALDVTSTVAYTLHGDPLRAVHPALDEVAA